MPKYGPTDEQNKEYFIRQEKARQEFEGYGSDYANGILSQSEFEDKMHDAITDFLIDLAILAEDENYEFTEDDINDLTSYTSDILDLLADMIIFVENSYSFSEDYLCWRAGIFSNARQVFMRFTMPRDIWLALPLLPGDDCLGDGACGCSWEIDVDDDGTIHAYWTLGETEHCVVCIEHELQYNPLVISADDL
jgi:hypothetical protein